MSSLALKSTLSDREVALLNSEARLIGEIIATRAPAAAPAQA